MNRGFEATKFLFAILSLVFLSFLNCDRGEKGEEKEQFRVWVEPEPGIYPQYSTFYIKIFANKKSSVYYTTSENLSPYPFEREYVRRGRINPPNPLTVPVVPDFEQGATLGTFYLNVIAISEDGETLSFQKRYSIILAPQVRISPPGGFYRQPITAFISCNKPCIIFYTLDGTEPEEGKAQKAQDSVILDIRTDTEVRFKARDTVLEELESPVFKENYWIDTTPPETQVLGIEGCECIEGCENQPPSVVKCSSQITVQLIPIDDKATSVKIYWTLDGKEPDENNLWELGGNTFSAFDSADIAIREHTILKFFSVDSAGNKESTKTVIILVGDSPFAWATPPGGIYGGDKIPLEVQIKALPKDSLVSWTLSFPDGTTSFVESCTPPCKLTLDKEGKNILVFRAFRGALSDKQRREDYILDKTPPTVFLDPPNCISEEGPLELAIKSDEENVQVLWLICEKGVLGCSLSECDPTAPDVVSGQAPVTQIVVEFPSTFYYCGIDRAGNRSDVFKTECDISGKYVETFETQDNMDSQNTTASWGGGVLELARDEVQEESFLDTAGSGTLCTEPYGKIVVMCDSGAGIRLVDISSLKSPSVISTFQVTGVVDAKVWGDAVLVLTNSQLLAVDISNPQRPEEVGSANLSADLSIPAGQAADIEIWGRYIVIGAGNQGIVLVGVKHERSGSSRSFSFERVGGITPRGNVVDIDVFGNLVFSAESGEGLRVIDIFDPKAPREVTYLSDFLQSGENAVVVKVFFPYVAVGTSNGSIYIFDILELPDVKLVSSIQPASGIRINDIQVFGSWLFVADAQGVKIIEIRDVENPRVVADIRRGGTLSLRILGDVAVAGDINSGLSILKVAQPSEFVRTYLDLSDSNFAESDGILALAGKNKVQLFDLSELLSPSKLTEISLNFDVAWAKVWGEYLVVGGGSNVVVFDILPLSSPEKVFEIDLSTQRSGATVNHLEVWGDLLLISAGNSLFALALTSIKSQDQVIFRYDTDVVRVDVSGDLVAVSTGKPTLTFLKIDEGRFVSVLENRISSDLHDTYYLGQLLASAQGISGFILYNISQVSRGRIQQVGAYPLSNALGLGDFGFISVVFGGNFLSLIDITYPDSPREIISVNESARDGKIYGDVAVVWDGNKVKLLRFARAKFLYKFEGKAQSINVTPDLETPIRDAQVRVMWCEDQDPLCDKFGCTVSFELSNNGGLTWVDVPANAGFFPFPTSGTSLMWRATLKTANPVVSPRICQLTIIYRFGRRR